jgi:hypothetical protein
MATEPGADGTLNVRNTSVLASPYSQALINFAAAGANIIIPALARQIIRVYRLKLVVQGTTVLNFQDGNTVIDGPLSFVANGAMVLDNSGVPWYTAFGAFIINSLSPVQVGGNVDYIQS